MGEMFPVPIAVTCARCATESQHNGNDLLALTPMCPACGSSLNAVGVQMGETLDDNAAYYAWLDLLIAAEERLGIGISDEDAFGGGERRFAALTLRDLTGLVRGYLPPDARSEVLASEVVLEAAAGVAKVGIDPADANRPILEALHLPNWAEKQGRTKSCT